MQPPEGRVQSDHATKSSTVMTRGDKLAAYRHVLQLAGARVFVAPPDLAAELAAQPFETLYALSQSPDRFGAMLPLDGDQRRDALSALLTAARALLAASRKDQFDLTRQLTLPLVD